MWCCFLFCFAVVDFFKFLHLFEMLFTFFLVFLNHFEVLKKNDTSQSVTSLPSLTGGFLCNDNEELMISIVVNCENGNF